ncbi:MAG: ABC transporter permease [Candidatus Bipolaricaulota bacterium]
MIAYIIRRLLQAILVLIGVSIISFIIFQFIGDPVAALVGKEATQQQREEVRRALGLHKPLHIQYINFLGNAARGKFGYSYVQRVPVLGLIMNRVPATFELATFAIVIAFVLGTSLGVFVSVNRASILSRLIMAGSLFGISIPTFLIGTLLILVFGVQFGLLPVMGRGLVIRVGFWKTGLLTLDGWRHIILPAVTLAMYSLAMLLRLTRSEMVEVLDREFVTTARSKGLSNRKVIYKHALRNALIPVVTMGGMQFGRLIAFSIVTETIFQWPGLGKLLLSSIYNNDRPVVVAYIMLAAAVILTLNLMVDLLYAVLNPRIRYS